MRQKARTGPEADTILEALGAQIAVTDRHGVITAVNRAWTRFGEENGGGATSRAGANYLAVCERAAEADPTVQAVVTGLRDLLSGAREDFSTEYPCHAPGRERWFVMRATPLPGRTGLVISHEEISERHAVEARLAETAQLLEKVLATLPVGVWIMDARGTIVQGNPEGQRIWAGARYVGPEDFGEYKGWWVSTGAPIAAEDWAGARAIRNGEVSVGEEIEIECFDGTRKIILNSAMPLPDGPSGVRGAIIVNQDITERKAAEEELRRSKEALEVTQAELKEALERERLLARLDPLTGIGNRRHFFDLAAHEFTVAQRYNHPLSLILFDIDHFKRINDLLGHDCGDEVLRLAADTAKRHQRHADLLARYGGEEFVILLPQTSLGGAVAVAERLRREFAEHDLLPAQGLRVSISCGVAEMQGPDETLDQLVRRADGAMYSAKRAGRNRTMLARPAPEAARGGPRCESPR